VEADGPFRDPSLDALATVSFQAGSLVLADPTPGGDGVKIEEAIRTALELERKIVTVYEAAARTTADPTGRRVFDVLASEERH
jgi:hypothetical protein